MKITVTPEQYAALQRGRQEAARQSLDGRFDEGYWMFVVRAVLGDLAVPPFQNVEVVIDWQAHGAPLVSVNGQLSNAAIDHAAGHCQRCDQTFI